MIVVGLFSVALTMLITSQISPLNLAYLAVIRMVMVSVAGTCSADGGPPSSLFWMQNMGGWGLCTDACPYTLIYPVMVESHLTFFSVLAIAPQARTKEGDGVNFSGQPFFF